ncbi:MAG: zinc-ribbon domain-containing protein [bacterium]|nr:zinc-ribbon domain-containing protein [bacterium]
MALIKCPDCQKMISDSAETCIHCGRPSTSGKTDFNARLAEIGHKSIVTHIPKCPTCGSTNVGARPFGARLFGLRTMQCRNCSHSW